MNLKGNQDAKENSNNQKGNSCACYAQSLQTERFPDHDRYIIQKKTSKIEKPRDGFFLRTETFYKVASNIEALDREPALGPRVIDSFGGVSLHEQSHGESF